MTEKRSRGFAPHRGKAMARTWATAYGSSWVLSSDLMEPPGVFSDYKKFQIIERAMNRSGYFLERQPYDDRSYLYRLSPEVVKELTYGGTA